MDLYENIFKSICRICLKHSSVESMVSLIDNSGEDGLSCYGKAVLTFANVVIKSNDILPSAMCQQCLYLLKNAITFKLSCESSYKRLKELSKNFSEIDTPDQNIKEKIVQYTMFIHYFPSENAKETNSSSDCTDNLLESKDLPENNNKFDIDVEKCENEVFDDHSQNDQFDQDTSDNNVQNSKLQEDDILDKLDKIIGTNTGLLNFNFKRRIKRRLLKRSTRQKRRRIERTQIESRIQDGETLICKVCHKVLANQHTYDHHMQRHNGCRYICEHCGKGFPVLAELQIHQVARHGTGPYLQCQHCNFKAPRKFDLIEHERIHTGERPYACDKCGLTFRRRGIWKKHLIYHMEKKVQCPQCPRRFYQRSEMLAHANNVHERVYMYLCSKCGATYAKPATVRRHLTERHGVPRELQGKVIRVNKGRGTEFPEQ